MKERFKKIWARKGVRWTIIIIVLVLLGWFFFGRSQPVVYETAAVTRGIVIESVTATGQIKPEEYASLRFKTAGTIARMNVDVGSAVVAGQILASLDTSELSKRVTQAEADLVGVNVALANAEQEVSDQQRRGSQAVTVLYTGASNTFNEILNLVQQAYASFATFYDTTGHLANAVASPILIGQRVVDADAAKASADAATQSIVTTLENFSPQADQDKVDGVLAAIHVPLQKLQESLTALVNAVVAIPSGAVSASTLAGYKDTLAIAKTNMNSAISKESTLVSNLRDTGVQNELALNTAQAAKRSAGAAVEKAKAALEIARQSLSDAYLRAPIAGTVAVKSKQLGELVTTADQVFYVIGKGGLEIVANIPEVDIAKVSVGDTADVGLDAYEDGATFPVTISAIDPAETIVDGIATYKATFTFNTADPRVRSGMTANIRIATDRRENVLVIPQRAITSKNGVKVVRIPAGEGQEPTEVIVQLGLRGNNGTVEVLEGVSEGTTIIAGTTN